MRISQNNLAWPLSVIILSLLIISMLLLNPVSPTAAPMLQEQECNVAYLSNYPACVTQTAAANSITSSPEEENNNNDGSSSSTNQANTTSTPTSTRTRTPTPTEGDAENSETVEEDLDAPTSTPAATRDQPTSTPTSTLPPDSDVLTCVPGVPLRIEGQTTPRTALLLYFNGRAVGGATSNVQGFYSIQMVVGDEKSGDYPLEIQVRGSREVVDEQICRVPGVSNTPTPTEIGAP